MQHKMKSFTAVALMATPVLADVTTTAASDTAMAGVDSAVSGLAKMIGAIISEQKELLQTETDSLTTQQEECKSANTKFEHIIEKAETSLRDHEEALSRADAALATLNGVASVEDSIAYAGNQIATNKQDISDAEERITQLNQDNARLESEQAQFSSAIDSAIDLLTKSSGAGSLESIVAMLQQIDNENQNTTDQETKQNHAELVASTSLKSSRMELLKTSQKTYGGRVQDKAVNTAKQSDATAAVNEKRGVITQAKREQLKKKNDCAAKKKTSIEQITTYDKTIKGLSVVRNLFASPAFLQKSAETSFVQVKSTVASTKRFLSHAALSPQARLLVAQNELQQAAKQSPGSEQDKDRIQLMQLAQLAGVAAKEAAASNDDTPLGKVITLLTNMKEKLNTELIETQSKQSFWRHCKMRKSSLR